MTVGDGAQVDADSMSSSSTVLDLSETEDLYYESYEEVISLTGQQANPSKALKIHILPDLRRFAIYFPFCGFYDLCIMSTYYSLFWDADLSRFFAIRYSVHLTPRKVGYNVFAVVVKFCHRDFWTSRSPPCSTGTGFSTLAGPSATL